MKKYILIIASIVAISALSAETANAQDFQTSTMMNTGSNYSSSVTAVGAQSVGDMATTTYEDNSSRANIRRIGGGGGMGEGDDPGQAADGSPIGAPLLPLVLMAAAYGTLRLRRKEE